MRRREFVATVGGLVASLTRRGAGIEAAGCAWQGRTMADGLGVNVRLGEIVPERLALAQSLGFTWLRTDVVWAQAEPRVDDFVFGPWTMAFERARQEGFRVIGILDYGHPVHTGGRPPTTASERARFVKFVSNAERVLGGLVDAWEVWNEPNYKGFWGPAPSASDFSQLLRDAAEAIWDIQPTRQVVAGGLSGFDSAFLSAITPALSYLSNRGPVAASVHPYRAGAPETLVDDLRAAGLLDATGRAWATYGVPLWVTEWGYCRLRENLGPIGQAEMDVRLPLVTAAVGVPVTILFELVDPRPTETECGQSYGLHRAGSLAPHPAADALRAAMDRFGRLSVSELGLLRTGSGFRLRISGGDLCWSVGSRSAGDSLAAYPTRNGLRVGGTELWRAPAPN